jgi:tetratricopeptide (TPR) repeat protein
MASERFCLFIVGRLQGLTRGRLAGLVAGAGGRLVREPSARVDLVAVGHGSAPVCLANGPPIELPEGVPGGAELMSELALKRLLGVSAPIVEENRTLTPQELARGARLDREIVRCLSLFDVLEPLDGRYGYRDLLAAREAARLLRTGLSLRAIVEAALELRQAGWRLSDTRVNETPWGELVQQVAGRVGRLDGQFTLPLEETFQTVDEIFEKAEEMEATGDLDAAERLYRTALRMDRSDPVLAFNLGNVLDAQGRPAEAILFYQQAIVRDPGFAEAWFNMAILQEVAGRFSDAVNSYRKAIEAQPGYADALYNLALLLTRREHYAAALPMWERYLDLKPTRKEGQQARRLAMMCRLQAAQRAD